MEPRYFKLLTTGEYEGSEIGSVYPLHKISETGNLFYLITDFHDTPLTFWSNEIEEVFNHKEV